MTFTFDGWHQDPLPAGLMELLTSAEFLEASAAAGVTEASVVISGGTLTGVRIRLRDPAPGRPIKVTLLEGTLPSVGQATANVVLSRLRRLKEPQ